MSRRPGQNGRIEQRGNTWYARFWLDEEGKDARTYKRVRICPVEGPGSLNASERKRRVKEIIAEFGANSEAHFRITEAANLGTIFKEQSEAWFQGVQKRRRRPIKPRTAETWKGYLKYLNSKIGEMPLAEINNSTMRNFISVMTNERNKVGEPRFSAKSIENYLAIVKMVVASVLNEKDEPVYPVKWNHEVMDLPIVESQDTPTFTAAEIETILSKSSGQERLLYACLAATGLRIGEAFALRVEDVIDNVISVKRSAWEGTMTSPKTENGKREVDVHSSLAEALRDHIGDRKDGLVFPSARGTPLRKSNLLRRSLHPILLEMGKKPCGFHAFRRFRVAHLRKQLVPEILLRVWVGHSTEGITDKYALEGVKRDTLFRTMTTQKAGVGFKLCLNGYNLHPVAPIEVLVSV
jgi:integrase